MKKLLFAAALLIAAGLVLLLLPLHVQMTGLVLLLLGLVAGVYALLFPRGGKRLQMALQILVIAAASCVIVLAAAMGLISAAVTNEPETALRSEYAVVLGSSVKSDGSPSAVLQSRIDAAYDFMEQNPDALLILSGGMGADEPTSEALCMYNALTSRGADPSRLILEDQSSTTRENFLCSSEILASRGGTSQPLTVITSDFHQCRSAYIACSMGLDICQISARTDSWFLRFNYTLREVFSFVKAAFQARGA